MIRGKRKPPKLPPGAKKSRKKQEGTYISPIHAWVTLKERTLKAVHIYGDPIATKTCPHCGVGLVRNRVDSECKYCKGKVSRIEKGD